MFLKYHEVYEHLSQPWFTDGGQDRAVARRLGISTSQMEDEWRWIESLYVDDSDLEVSFWSVYYLTILYGPYRMVHKYRIHLICLV